jgi:hypothetical protein
MLPLCPTLANVGITGQPNRPVIESAMRGLDECQTLQSGR